MKKIGIGIITCNREKFFKQCIDSIPSIGDIVVVNDGKPYDNSVYPSKMKDLIQHTTNKCVGISKNEALRWLIQNDCTYLFLIEDDMIIKKPEVFEKYIIAGAKSGIFHMNYYNHGNANRKPDGSKNPREIIDYGNEIEIGFFPNCVGALSFYHKGVIKAIGYMDERFINSWEHCDHTYRAIVAGLHSPWWWFADLANSEEYIVEQGTVDTTSVIRKTPEWIKGMQIGAAWFKHKHGYIPTEILDTSPEIVRQKLEEIQKKYSRDLSLI